MSSAPAFTVAVLRLGAMVDLDSHVLRNRRVWDRLAREYAEPGRRLWSSAEPAWGIWNIPESKANVLPGAAGRDVLELGCGTGYVSAWLARRGGRPVGLDNSRVQLTTARRLQQDFGLAFPLVQADAERVPLADACFDVVISEYGASIWCDPYRWIPEVSRLLRPGGELVFLVNGAILMLCAPDEEGRPATDRLLRPYFGMLRCEGPQDESVDFHLGHGDPSEALPETLAGPWPSEREVAVGLDGQPDIRIGEVDVRDAAAGEHDGMLRFGRGQPGGQVAGSGGVGLRSGRVAGSGDRQRHRG